MSLMSFRSVMKRRRALFGWLAAALLWTSGAHAADADPRATGPRGLAIAVHVRPADRPALRRAMERRGVALFEQRKAAGTIGDYHVLFSRYPDAPNWDLLVLVNFTSPGDITRWQAIEQQAPAGLPPEALALATSIQTTPMDQMRGASASTLAVKPTWLIVPYDYLVSTNEYIAYLDGYLVPQVTGWIDEGIVSRYGLYIARYGAGRAWSSLFAIEYRDDDALGARDRVVARVRARLATDPQWKQLSDNKDKVRTEGAPVIADELAVHR